MGRKKKDKLDYFSEREENAVLDYINSDDKAIKDKIYNNILKEPFRIMTESILRKYPIYIGKYDIHEVEANALSHLIENMINFDPNKKLKNGNKAKAFSYCQTIIRNFYRTHSERAYKETLCNLSFDDYCDEIQQKNDFIYNIDDDEKSPLEILIESIINKIEIKVDNDEFLKENEIKVGFAIINVLKNWNILFMEDSPDGIYHNKITNKYTKNKILLLLKEQTNLSTKDIRVSMKSFKEIYFIEKSNIFNEV